MSKKQNNTNKIYLGNHKPDRAGAWFELPRKAKIKLAQERRAGNFGGTPGRAPYWWAINYGLASARIEKRLFLQRAVSQFRLQARAITRVWLRS
ncbi:MAG: hypothetical protein HY868_25540 [Chloroflexi bacterium]|nr:hypothetical protein [Chloroflexota bacterium]